MLFHCGDNGARYAFVLGGGALGGGAWEEELCGDFLSRYGKGGYEEKSPIYMGNCGRLCGGSCRLVHWGGKAMKGQRVIQWSDMKACWRTKMKA
ncbi:hypothetical protein [Bartonella sp. AA97HXZ]|uniref:hypothetical protein n=1 Tax=Bartonella sp. AA97HXZ TaxID=1460972 RepID=UPI0035CF547D